MAEATQILRIKCPHCGWVRRITIHVNAGKVDVVAGPENLVLEMKEKLKNLFADRELDELNAWIALPPCPNLDPPCGKIYEYNVRTGETRK